MHEETGACRVVINTNEAQLPASLLVQKQFSTDAELRVAASARSITRVNGCDVELDLRRPSPVRGSRCSDGVRIAPVRTRRRHVGWTKISRSFAPLDGPITPRFSIVSTILAARL